LKIERLISIVMMLLERRIISATELAKTFEVSTRTIYRDMDTLNQAGIPIVAYPGVNGGVGIMDGYKLEKRLFTTIDITILLMGLGSIQSPIDSNEITSALSKITSMMSDDQRSEIEAKANRITIDVTPWSGVRPYVLLIEKIQSAIENNRILSFKYSDRKQNHTARKIEPYCLLLKNTSWYVKGYCLSRNDFRLFKLSRMFDTIILNDTYSPREFDLHKPYQLSFPGKPNTAMLRVSESAREILLDLFGEECMEQESEWTWIARIPISHDHQGYSFILSLGHGCEVLEPIEYRKQIKSYLMEIYGLYEKNS